MKIYVDADACPVKDEAVRVAERHELSIVMVANSHMRLPQSPFVERVVVDNTADAADDWIAAHIASGDVVVTADIPLASRCLHAGAKVLAPDGRVFDDANIGAALAMRELLSELRQTGDVAGNNPVFTKRDRSQFLQALEQAIQDIKRGR